MLETAAGTTEPLARNRYRPVLITMFYTHCASVCPILTAELQRLDSRLPVEQRARVAVLMVSLDSDGDTPAELRRFADEHKIIDPRWTLARTSPAGTRTLAAALGIRFKKLPDGSFDHSTTIVLLDADGVPRDRTSELLGTSDRFVDAVASLVRRETR
jgi:protein SCO1/2